MNKMLILLAVFLVFGALIIKDQPSDGKPFLWRVVYWVGDVFANVKDLTGHAINDYQWLPGSNKTEGAAPSGPEAGSALENG